MAGLTLIKIDIDKSMEFGHIDQDKEMLVSIKDHNGKEELIYIDTKDIEAIIRHLEFELKRIG